MGVWHNAFFFPAADQQLDAAAAVASLVKDGYEVDNPARCLIPTDDEGHLGEYGAEVVLDDPLAEDLMKRLRSGDQLFVEISKRGFSSSIVPVFACSFATKAANSHSSIGWPKRLFEKLPQEDQTAHWMAIKDAARAIRAAYVVLVIEASDNFEDRFLEVDGKRFLDTECHHQYGHGIWSVWVDQELGGECPDGVAEATAVDLGGGVTKYDVG